MKFIKIFSLALAAVAVASCSHSDRWSVNGHVTGADGQLLTLERSTNGRWYVVDSLRLDEDGKYRFAADPSGYPEIYRLNLDGKSTAYFPVDSIETIQLDADAASFATKYTLSGSANAEKFKQANDLINARVAKLGNAAVTDTLLKRSLSTIILNDMSSVVSYYLINKEIGGRPIFDPRSRSDLRVIGAVTNAFSALRPDDPRTELLKQQYIAWRRATSDNRTQVEAVEIGFPEIALKDANGKEVKLSDIAGHGRPVILNFTAYATENSPAINLALANIYNAGGVDIYQVSIDTDEYLWREAARNLPWTAVLKSPRDGDRVLLEYNVGAIPQSFIIDGQGQLRERVADMSQLAAAVKKY